MKEITWRKTGNVFEALFFHNGISIKAAIFPDRTSKAVAGQIGTANHDSSGAALRLPDGRWFHPAVTRVERARVHINSGMKQARALANAWAEELEAAQRFQEAEKGTPHLRRLVVEAKRGSIMERKEIGELDMLISFFGGPSDAFSALAIELAGETTERVLKIIRSLVDNKAA